MRTITVEMDDAVAEQLELEARKLNLSVEKLIYLRAEKMLSKPDNQFETVARRIVQEDKELLRRLA